MEESAKGRTTRKKGKRRSPDAGSRKEEYEAEGSTALVLGETPSTAWPHAIVPDLPPDQVKRYVNHPRGLRLLLGFQPNKLAA